MATPVAPLQASAPTATDAAAQAASAVVAYLQGAEVQAENDAQRRELQRALADLLYQPAETLRAARYSAASGEPGQRDLAQLLRGHLVPASPQALDTDQLFAAKDDPQVRAAVRYKHDEVGRILAANASPASQGQR